MNGDSADTSGSLRLDLGGYLKAHQFTAHRLALELRGQVPRSTVYSMARQPRRRINLGTVSQVLSALGRLRGEDVSISALIVPVTLPGESRE